jgi:microcystin-dependent protein
MSEPFIGQIMMFAGNFAPQGWALCDGSLLSISQNTALFSILGTTYGGNGQTNFALPDLRGRVPVHQGSGPGLSSYSLGQSGGSENVTLTGNQLPSHTHGATATVTINANGNRADQTAPGGSVPAGGNAPQYASRPDGSTTMNAGMASASVNVQPSGGSQPFSVIQPYLCVNFVIALQGIFPSRN